jgi:hypothetical protein
MLETCEEFTRVILEVPVRQQFPLPPLPEPFAGGFGHSLKHPSGTLALAERLHKLNITASDGNGHSNGNGHKGVSVDSAPEVPSSYIEDLKAYDFSEIETPDFLFLETTALSLFKHAADLAARLSTPEIKVINGYSIKTNPDERLVRMAEGSARRIQIGAGYSERAW